MAWLLLACSALLACRREPELPKLGQVTDFALTNQDGRSLARAELAGSVWVAAFMFTRCPTVCPRITQKMKQLQSQAKADDVAVRFISFSVDPDHDSPAVLKRYALSHGADLSSWSFATGDIAAIRRTSVEGFKLALDKSPNANDDHLGIVHGSHFVLVDRAGFIRGYYSSSDDTALRQLLVDAKRLQD
jgi:protein SCO1/2